MTHKTWYVLLNPETDQPDTSCGYALQCDGNVMTDSIETLEQAETIRRAVNSHAAMLEALEAAVEYEIYVLALENSERMPNTHFPETEWCIQARAALKLAKGD